MSASPQVSVVMSVYNGANHLAETLDSVLGQEGCDFEFIVVNDGSTDATADILDSYSARDNRLRVIHQENTGLTRALIRGCAEARGEFIARQDAGDISLPGRLKQQHEFMKQHPDAVMSGCAVRFLGPKGEPLYEIAKPMLQLDGGLRQLDSKHLKGPPHHGGTLFRRLDYIKAGGYRAQFVVAQDIDLWLRLSELGLCLGMLESLYLAKSDLGSISSRRRVEQLRASNLAIACARARRVGGDESRILDNFISEPKPKSSITRIERARFHYFIGSCLRGRDRGAAKNYFRMALQDNPFHFKAFIRYVTI